MACQNLFIRDLLIRPTKEELKTYVPDFVILVAPGFKCVPERDGTHSEAAIIIDYEAHKILIAGTAYSGEIKKSVFSTMNYFMTKRDVMPMHCSANIGKDGDTAIFFGLSGTGKTTLSADPNRQLIGDDEHGWSNDGVFNFEGGCYAKCIDLSKEGEPEIYNAIKFGALVENVVMDDDTRTYDFTNRSLTENTRVGYPIDYIPSAKIPSVGSQPKTVIFLTADAFGVLPPISKLTLNQAMYYFVSGYTSKLAGTERGITTPQATFSTCFGEPFLPLDPSIYARMLSEKVAANNANVFLVNTGWSGGAYGKGSRMKLKYTRAMVTAALNGTLNNVKYVVDDIFGLAIPTSCPDVPSEILIPSSTWEDKKEYEKTARELAKRFQENFKKYTHMSQEVVESGPKVK
jgi:phosphoenolpyruvate carboxykinase (ATP)